MSVDRSGARSTRVRECVCCGSATATNSIPACWDDWNFLPEDLRSSIVRNYGRRQIKEYADDLLTAVAFWREIGAWRSKLRKRPFPIFTASEPAGPIAGKVHNVIPLAERRRTAAMQIAPEPDDEAESASPLPMTAAR